MAGPQKSILTKLRKINDKKGTRISDVLNEVGAGDIFTVHIAHGDGTKLPGVTVDKTSADIVEALNAGKAVQVIYTAADGSVHRFDMHGTLDDGILKGSSVAINSGNLYVVYSLEVDFADEIPEISYGTAEYALTPSN